MDPPWGECTDIMQVYKPCVAIMFSDMSTYVRTDMFTEMFTDMCFDMFADLCTDTSTGVRHRDRIVFPATFALTCGYRPCGIHKHVFLYVYRDACVDVCFGTCAEMCV